MAPAGKSGDWGSEEKYVLRTLQRMEAKMDYWAEQHALQERRHVELRGRVSSLEKAEHTKEIISLKNLFEKERTSHAEETNKTQLEHAEELAVIKTKIATMQTRMLIYTGISVFILTALAKYLLPTLP